MDGVETTRMHVRRKPAHLRPSHVLFVFPGWSLPVAGAFGFLSVCDSKATLVGEHLSSLSRARVLFHFKVTLEAP